MKSYDYENSPAFARVFFRGIKLSLLAALTFFLTILFILVTLGHSIKYEW